MIKKKKVFFLDYDGQRRIIKKDGNYLIKDIIIDGENMTDLSLKDGYYFYKFPSLVEHNVSFLIDLENCDSLSEMFYGAVDIIEISFIKYIINI